MEAASVAVTHEDHHEHHGPPPANRSSRVEPQLLGMLLFIVSEVMVFGAFFTAYFFIRVVNGDHWFPLPNGDKLPVAVAGVNAAILFSSSLTMHWAQTSIKNGNRFGLKAGILSTLLLGATLLVYDGAPDWGPAPQGFNPGRLWDLLDRHQLTHLGARVNSLAWSPDSRWIAFSAARQGSFDIWKVSVPDGKV